MNRLFVAASGTEIGKTFVSCLILRGWRDDGLRPKPLKPVASGYDDDRPEASDAGLLLAAADYAGSIADISPWQFLRPLSPPHAADAERRRIDLSEVAEWCGKQAEHDGPVLVESAGGLCSPLSHEATMLDLAVTLGWPLLLIGGTGLGEIGHLLAAERAALSAGLTPAGLVVSESADGSLPLDTHGTAIERLSPGGAPFLVPRVDLDAPGGDAHAAEIGQSLVRWLERRR